MNARETTVNGKELGGGTRRAGGFWQSHSPGRLTNRAKKNLMGYLFIAPALLFFIVFTALPIILCIYLSLTDYDLNTANFIGFENFAEIFRDKIYWRSILNVLIYTVFAVPLNIAISIGLPALLNRDLRGIKVFRALYYLPGLTSAVAACTVWLNLMNPQFGVLNTILNFFGIPDCPWLTHSRTSMMSIIIITLWMGVGGNMIVVLAAMQGLPETLYESAQLDGASKPRQFFSITLPLLRPTTYFIMTMGLIGAFQLYDQVYMLTFGGPANSTITPVYLIWQNSFDTQDAGLGSAQAVVLFVIIMIVTFVMQKINKENY